MALAIVRCGICSTEIDRRPVRDDYLADDEFGQALRNIATCLIPLANLRCPTAHHNGPTSGMNLGLDVTFVAGEKLAS